MSVVILFALALQSSSAEPGFDDVLRCMDTNVERYARVTNDFSMALDAAWTACESLSAKQALAMYKSTPPKILTGSSVGDIQKSNRDFFYGEYRASLTKIFLDAQLEGKGESPALK